MHRLCTGRTPGTLADTGLGNTERNERFLAFLRLVVTVYFKKHAHGFSTPPPVTLFNKYYNQQQQPRTLEQHRVWLEDICQPCTLEQHRVWLEDIWQNIWDYIQFEDETIPSVHALYRHWKRVCWVIDMWHQANRNVMELMSLTEFGWTIDENNLTLDWDSQEKVDAVKQRVASLIRGCKCRTGCGASHCGFKKNTKICSMGCECINCLNTATPEPATDTTPLIPRGRDCG